MYSIARPQPDASLRSLSLVTSGNFVSNGASPTHLSPHFGALLCTLCIVITRTTANLNTRNTSQ